MKVQNKADEAYKKENFTGVAFLIVIILLFFFSSLIFAQSNNVSGMEASLSQLSKEAAASYIRPIVTGFGACLNGGWFHKAASAKIMGFDVEIGMVGMGTFFTEENQNFSSDTEFQFSRNQAYALTGFVNENYSNLSSEVQQAIREELAYQIIQEYQPVNISGPTMLGSSLENMKISYSENEYNIDVSGFNGSVTIPDQEIILSVTGKLEYLLTFPLITPQLSIGTILGSRLIFRYQSNVEINPEIGQAMYSGFGLQHNPTAWLPVKLPIDFSLGFFSQSLLVGNVLSVKASGFGLNASKCFGRNLANLTPYVGLLVENCSVNVTYDYNIQTANGTETQKVTFEMHGENKSRFTFGINLKLLIFNINADYNIGTYNSGTVGIMLAF